MVCPVYEQNFQATEFLFGSGVFLRRTALDSFRRRAQHRSYTNKYPGGGKPR
jgi:hypothetical protein